MIDMHFEDQMSEAVGELRDQLDRQAVPVFVPSRSHAPLAAAAALVMLLGLGLLWGAVGNNDDPTGGVVVATQPDRDESAPVRPDGGAEDGVVAERGASDSIPADSAASDAAVPESIGPDAGADRDSAAPVVVGALTLAPGAPRVGQLTAAQPGEFIVPSPGASAWNADETAVLLYRTGDTSPGHIVVSAVTGDLVAQVDLAPPDIEQVYWHPAEPTQLVAFEDDGLWSFDLTTAERTLLHTFAACQGSTVDAGYPSPPSVSGVLVGLCAGAQATIQVHYDLFTGVETAAPGDDSATSVHVSPSGATVISVLADGSAVARTAGSETGLDLGGDVFTFVTVDGAERLAATRYGGASIGTLVLFDLTDGTSRVVIGPDAGDGYPPSGSNLSGAGSRVIASTRGPAGDGDGGLAGRILFIDLAAGVEKLAASFEHRSAGTHGYWSDAFVSLSPSGRYGVYASDGESDRVDTYLVEFPP